MSPFLERESPEQDQEYKFVRVNDRIAYDSPDKEHAQIAAEHGIGKSLSEYAMGRQVDDGGHLSLTQTEGYRVGGTAHSCELRSDLKSARSRTTKVIEKITGVKAKHTSFTS